MTVLYGPGCRAQESGQGHECTAQSEQGRRGAGQKSQEAEEGDLQKTWLAMLIMVVLAPRDESILLEAFLCFSVQSLCVDPTPWVGSIFEMKEIRLLFKSSQLGAARIRLFT